MSNDQSAMDIRTLFDWKRTSVAAGAIGGRPAVDVPDDDLELALKLVSCNSRDRKQFLAHHAAYAPDAGYDAAAA
jgi:hypothetical protein